MSSIKYTVTEKRDADGDLDSYVIVEAPAWVRPYIDLLAGSAGASDRQADRVAKDFNAGRLPQADSREFGTYSEAWAAAATLPGAKNGEAVA